MLKAGKSWQSQQGLDGRSDLSGEEVQVSD